MGEAEREGAALREDSRVVVRDGLSSCDLADARVVLDLENGEYHGMNEVAAFLWERIAEPTRVSDLLSALLSEYEVDPETARADLLDLLGALRSKGLIEVQGGAGS